MFDCLLSLSTDCGDFHRLFYFQGFVPHPNLRRLLFCWNIESYIVNEGGPLVVVGMGVANDKEVWVGRSRRPTVDRFVSIGHNRIEISRILVRTLVVMPNGSTILNEIPMVAKGGLADKTKVTADLKGITTPVAFDCKAAPPLPNPSPAGRGAFATPSPGESLPRAQRGGQGEGIESRNGA